MVHFENLGTNEPITKNPRDQKGNFPMIITEH